MSEVTVVPSTSDNSAGYIALFLIGLVLLGIFAFTNGWFSMSTSNPDTNINVTVPNSTPTPTTSTSETESFGY